MRGWLVSNAFVHDEEYLDPLFGPDGAPMVCEVNANAHSIPEMVECCGVNVADEIIAHVVRVPDHQ